ncbi:Adenylate and Guanylate cyclase [Oryctes borbonicus]|uniref:Adenylate cyclase type 9 n=1 Tax=Oryctes borbonicus TaxID=1629725 RepID=A0A0T6AX69_9SCAR|nr:Adenylate and Guanylate cyclase [Oryctes borbonicus]
MTTSEKRVSSVSFTNSESQNLNDADHPSDIIDEDTAQISLDPCVQTYLAEVSQQSGCWGRYLPIPFERAASKSWWDPMFDSEILEDQFKKSSSNHNRIQFRYVLWYLLVLAIIWFIGFLLAGISSEVHHWPQPCTVLVLVIVLVLLVFLTTYTNFFNVNLPFVSFVMAALMCAFSILFAFLIPRYLEPLSKTFYTVGHFSTCTEILLLIYTMIPLRMYVCILLGVLYSMLFEITAWLVAKYEYSVLIVVVRFLTHVCVHLIGLHILIMNNVRMRNTFMKVGHSLLVRRQLESEKKLKENMIHSLMPPSVANWLMSDDENFKKNGMEPRHSDPETGDITKSLFRPFNMNRMENVSILFADIVGFTKMSSNKTAEELVEILNNLFQRFDLLCKFHNCEKISTLGDCYYCVSGCPEPVPDHAKCCVEMGLSMIQAIKQFDHEKNEGVNMRVGIHTGTVLCGIVGTRRFKFDVWSNDVTLANSMESTSMPGMVHISEKTKQFLPDEYVYEDGPQVSGFKTYFILGRKCERISSYNGSFRAKTSNNRVQASSLQLIISPPTSPPHMSPQTRPRVLSCDTSSLKPHGNPNQLSPDVCKIKANSLPSILDSENEHDNPNIECDSKDDNGQVKTPTSTASSGKYSVKIKTWKIPKFLKKLDVKDTTAEQNMLTVDDSGISTTGYHQVPTIIETQSGGKKPDGSWANVSQCEFEEQKDVIDIKSYISQSRSDIAPYEYGAGEFSHFIRTGSYRSQYGRSPNELCFLSRAGSNRSKRGRSPNFDYMPSERARSITVSHLDRQRTCLEVPHRLSTILLDDQLSMGHSINSRKDSGIRSNSRKSSIQPIENPYPTSDNLNHRVSGYFTSSQSTINSPPCNASRLPGPFVGKSIQRLRKQSDRQLIKCVQDNSKSKHSYFMKPPVSKCSLFFEDRKIEQEYRKIVHAMPEIEAIPTLANSKFNTCFDIFVSLTIFLIVSICLLLLFKPRIAWIVAFCVFLILQIFGVALCTDTVSRISDRFFTTCADGSRISWFANCSQRICTRWYRWNTFGGVLVSLPLIAVLINFSYPQELSPKTSYYLYNYLLFIGVIHFCNFTQLNCWMRNIILTILGVVFMSLVLSRYSTNSNNSQELPKNTTALESHQRLSYHRYDSEIFLDLLLLIILVWILNRQFEKGYRLSFHAHFVANRDRIHMLNLKNQADWLIYNIVPEHVAEQLKKNAAYSENFKNVGIIFASIVNFNEMYDESYLGGKEFLRVLNELIGDFDELLRYPQFYCVEKIKTIGSTFMAASGLNSKMRGEQEDPNEHLYALMEFAMAMQDVIDNFNRDLLEFNLILRIGYNFGDVTAAVIGNTKLYYDIWGDAVNIASRMDSTGVNGRIQVGEHCLGILEKRYSFQKRGSVYVKGKDNMDVYLLLRKNDECSV